MAKLQWGKLHTVEALLTNTLIAAAERATYNCLHKTLFSSTAIQTLYFYIPVSSQLQLYTPFSCPKGVHSQELPLYFDYIL